jgi:hypothetical protein
MPIVIDQIGQAGKAVERQLAHHAPTRALAAIPRTARFMGETVVARYTERPPGLPNPALSVGLVAQVAIDETMLSIAMGPNRFPRRADYERVGAELAHARLLFEDRGWLEDPRSYHLDPPPLVDPAITKGWALGTSIERLVFPSGFSPREEEPGHARWVRYEANTTALATVLRHRDRPRPWVVAIHGFAMGYPSADLIGLGALRLHRDLGFNVAMPTLPLHGPRRVTRISGEAMLSFDLIDSLHGLAQAVWDVRRVISWVRTQSPTGIVLGGVSLGGYLAALVAGIEPDLDGVIAGVPVVDFPALFHAHSPTNIRLRSIEHEILGGNAETVHQVVQPCSFPALVPQDRRFVFAGTGDRMATAMQAHQLWRHWEGPEMCWYAGNHVGYLWAPEVRRFVGTALRNTLPEALPAP